MPSGSSSAGPERGHSGASKPAGASPRELVPGFAPEGDLERGLIADPEVVEGLAWGKPRSGHPEGSVGAHVADLLETIDRWGETGQRRAELRFLALVHDSMKYRVRDCLPKVGENHHAARARRLAQRYTSDQRLLGAIEQHDRPYQLWRRMRRTGRRSDRAFDRMRERVPDRDLFMRFVELDGSTEGKNPEPVDWLREELRRRAA